MVQQRRCVGFICISYLVLNVFVCVSNQVCVDRVQAADSPVHFRQWWSGSIAVHRHIVTFHHQHAAMAHTDLW